ncbi:hypothetical protein CEXT_778801 [Caerostris extrusa]|uniref:Uncharacterized protein n=1 Tax=Caerostris extrusa TaxID=172846 RepID=A0AAV4Y5H1_CAEEX|nr:hypothetical protein CEXT_778801 [Caerostris extrusa]
MLLLYVFQVIHSPSIRACQIPNRHSSNQQCLERNLSCSCKAWRAKSHLIKPYYLISNLSRVDLKSAILRCLEFLSLLIAMLDCKDTRNKDV